MKIIATIAFMLASVLVVTPADAAKRKTLLEILFPRINERHIKREPVETVKISAPKNYNYRVAKTERISLRIENDPASTPENLSNSNDDEQKQPEKSLFERDVTLVGEFDFSAEANLAGAISGFYQENPKYIWINEEGALGARAQLTLNVLEAAGQYGLKSEDYSILSPDQVNGVGGAALANARLRSEVSMTLAVLRYAMDARYGRVNPNRLSGYHDFPERSDMADSVLKEVFGGGLPVNKLLQSHPASDKFLALKRELAALQKTDELVINLQTDILIKPGVEHPELPNVVDAIRKRASAELLESHGALLTAYDGSSLYTPELVALVKAYQKEAGLGADGVVGRRTASKLVGVGPAKKIMRVTMAMERLRWLPHKLGERHVFINQPAYRAMYIEGGSEKLSMRAIVGKPSNQTSFFYDEVENVVYNPYWGVPRSIIVNEMLPKLREDPSYLDARGYELTDSRGRRVASSEVDWYEVDSNPRYDVRQPPGSRNALGRVKILFPNKHAIYMHDTPSRGLFSRSQRALSHGCVRLQKPQEMAAAVLGKSKEYVDSKIATGKNITEDVAVKIPVYVSYFTAWPKADATIGYYPDIYGRDRNLEKAMSKTSAARVALNAALPG